MKAKDLRAKQTKLENSSRRRLPTRAPHTRLLIVCGAKCTEPTYLNGLRNRTRHPAITVKILVKDKDPRAAVRYAQEHVKASRDSFDQVWCVLDVDAFDYAEALKLASKYGIHL